MSILIKGMKMPKDYGRCVVIFPDGRVTTEFGTQVIASAIPVPPHGRLIDEMHLNMQIQTAKETHENEKQDFCNAFDNNGHVCTEWWCVEDMIDGAPTIIPAEEEV